MGAWLLVVGWIALYLATLVLSLTKNWGVGGGVALIAISVMPTACLLIFAFFVGGDGSLGILLAIFQILPGLLMLGGAIAMIIRAMIRSMKTPSA